MLSNWTSAEPRLIQRFYKSIMKSTTDSMVVVIVVVAFVYVFCRCHVVVVIICCRNFYSGRNKAWKCWKQQKFCRKQQKLCPIHFNNNVVPGPFSLTGQNVNAKNKNKKTNNDLRFLFLSLFQSPPKGTTIPYRPKPAIGPIIFAGGAGQAAYALAAQQFAIPQPHDVSLKMRAQITQKKFLVACYVTL